MKKDKNKLVLVGAKHVGKTSVGVELSKIHNIPFLDSDELILNFAKEQQIIQKQEDIKALYKKIGKNEFHNLELKIVSNIVVPQYVLATGGGIVESSQVWDIFSDAVIILLKVPFDIVWERINSLETLPAFLQNKENPKKTFKTIFELRQSQYIKHADIIFTVNDNTKNFSPSEIASILQKQIVAYTNKG